ncbi:hypothetical protein [[Clostridium] symbiosum]|uniref:hypothetical protein n=1 Tax=Clostridium symbiosum TaxID=1512 RepID=UPI00321A6FE6
MRKIKKINGYLVVKFNDRELREWADTALGNYGVIDAELYTGCLDVDRSVMEYDGAETLEEAIEQARGLESELEVDEPSATYTVIKETDDATKEDTVEPQLMIAGWKSQLETQVKSRHYSDIDPRTAAHELYGFMVALERLGLIEEEDCFVKPDIFKPQPDDLFEALDDGGRPGSLLDVREKLSYYLESLQSDAVGYSATVRTVDEMKGFIDALAMIGAIDRDSYWNWLQVGMNALRKKSRPWKGRLNAVSAHYRAKARSCESSEDSSRKLKTTAREPASLRRRNYSITPGTPLYPYGEHRELLEDRPYRATDAAEYRRRLRESTDENRELKKVFLHGVKIQGEWYRSPELGALIGQQVFVKSQCGVIIAETINGVEIGELTLFQE